MTDRDHIGNDARGRNKNRSLGPCEAWRARWSLFDAGHRQLGFETLASSQRDGHRPVLCRPLKILLQAVGASRHGQHRWHYAYALEFGRSDSRSAPKARLFPRSPAARASAVIS
jgi:hypothetical protein